MDDLLASRALLARRVAVALLVTLELVAAGRFLHLGLSAVAFRFPLDYEEGPMLEQAVRLAHGLGIYRATFAHPPFTVANYPPLFLLLQAPFVRLFGPAFWYGRGLALLGTLGAALLAGLTLWHLTGDRLAATFAGLLVLVLPAVAYWAPLDRVDLVALGFAWGALFVLVTRSHGRVVDGGLLATAALLVAAIYTKQTYALAAPFAAFVWLVGSGRRSAALLLTLLVAGGSLALFALVDHATQHGFFLNVVAANGGEYRPWAVRVAFQSLAGQLPIALILFVAFPFLAARRRPPVLRLVAPYALGALVSALAVGRIGSSANHLIELSVAIAVAAGATLALLRERPWLRTIALALLAVQVGLLLHVQGRSQIGWWNLLGRSADFARMEDEVRRTKGPILLDEWMGLLPLEGRPIYVQPAEMVQNAREKLWDATPFIADLAAGRFPLVAIYYDPGYPRYAERWSPAMLAALAARYQPATTLLDTVFYRPRPAGGPSLSR